MFTNHIVLLNFLVFVAVYLTMIHLMCSKGKKFNNHLWRVIFTFIILDSTLPYIFGAEMDTFRYMPFPLIESVLTFLLCNYIYPLIRCMVERIKIVVTQIPTVLMSTSNKAKRWLN